MNELTVQHNYGCNEEIMDACRTLKEYAMFVERVKFGKDTTTFGCLRKETGESGTGTDGYGIQHQLGL